MEDSEQPHTLVLELARHFPLYLKRVADLDKDAVPALLADYARYLADIPTQILALIVREAIQTAAGPYDFPTVGKLRQMAAARMLNLPGEADALAQVEARQRWAKGDRETTAPSLHPLVQQAVDLLGGFSAFRASEQPSVVRGQFGRIYRDLRSQALREAQIGSLRALPPGSRH